MSISPFSIVHLTHIYEKALKYGYDIISCLDFVRGNYDKNKRVLINRVDVDLNCGGVWVIANLFRLLGIGGTMFFRTRGPYNLYYETNYDSATLAKNLGIEIGLHEEVLSAAARTDSSPSSILKNDIKVLEDLLNIRIHGVSSHNQVDGINNLHFWRRHTPKQFGLEYQAYEFFDSTFYVSDSDYTRWKCFNAGKFVVDDRRCVCFHIENRHPVLYMLIHPVTFLGESKNGPDN